MQFKKFNILGLLTISSAWALPTIFPETTDINPTAPETATIFPELRPRLAQNLPTTDEPAVIFPELKRRDAMPDFTCEEHIAEFFSSLGFKKIEERSQEVKREMAQGETCQVLWGGKVTCWDTRNGKNIWWEPNSPAAASVS